MIDDECAPRGYRLSCAPLWDSKLFGPAPFTEREAFFWMMKEAFYADERSWINGIASIAARSVRPRVRVHGQGLELDDPKGQTERETGRALSKTTGEKI